jgi:hypothetical protein
VWVVDQARDARVHLIFLVSVKCEMRQPCHCDEPETCGLDFDGFMKDVKVCVGSKVIILVVSKQRNVMEFLRVARTTCLLSVLH